MQNNTSQHILNTSATLLGFCLVVITSFHVNNSWETTIIDELTALVALVLTISCFFSFISIRAHTAAISRKMETIADYLFIAGLIGVLVIIISIGINYIN